MLANGALQALAVAKAAGAAFVRVNQWANAYVANEGLIEGQAARGERYRGWLRAQDVRIFADVHVKHGAHAIVADRTHRRADPRRRVLRCRRGHRHRPAHRRRAPRATSSRRSRKATELPVMVGSGVTPDNVAEILPVADARHRRQLPEARRRLVERGRPEAAASFMAAAPKALNDHAGARQRRRSIVIQRVERLPAPGETLLARGTAASRRRQGPQPGGRRALAPGATSPRGAVGADAERG